MEYDGLGRICRVAMLSVHTSPLAAPGGKKTGGMNVYIREVSRELGRRGIGVDIFTRADAPDLPRYTSPDPNVRVIHVNAGPPEPRGPDDLYSLLPDFRREVEVFAQRECMRYDVIFSHYWLSGWVAEGLRSDWGIPVIQMFHTLGRMKERIALQSVGGAMRLRISEEAAIMGWADLLIAATPAERAQMLWLYRADRRKIAVVPPGVDVEHFKPIAESEARGLIGLHAGLTLMLYVGRIEPLKGVDILLRAIAQVRETAPATAQRLHVAVIGGDVDSPAPEEELERLMTLRSELGLEDQVDFVGARTQDVLPYYYAAAQALIMPSDYESFGMVALEAMACGTPVIASETGGLAFLIQDGINGFHVPTREPSVLADRILQIAENPGGNADIRQAARSTATHYSWGRIADRLIAVFESEIERRRGGLGWPSN